jgi:ribosome-binding factor A
MSGRRPERVAEALRTELADLLLREVKDPRIGMITLTSIRVSDDLRHARVYFSCVGDDAARNRCLSGLRSAAGYMQGQIMRRLNLRHRVEIRFEFDPSLEAAERLEDLLRRSSPPDD